MNEGLGTIPDDASVTATTFYVPVYQSIRYCMNYIIPTNRQSI